VPGAKRQVSGAGRQVPGFRLQVPGAEGHMRAGCETSATPPVKGTTLMPFLFVVRQNKWYLEVATSRTVVASLICTMDSTLSGPIRATVIALAP
jgi:hypothetical protein